MGKAMPMTTGFHPWGVGRSDPGRVRSNNEDRLICDNEQGIYAVIDGVGGHAAGERAAEIAVEMTLKRLSRHTADLDERLREAITVANNEIYQQALDAPECKGMACVMTVAVVAGNRVVIGHVGDTRLYLLRNGQMRKLTPDHSPVGQREDQGSLAEIEAMRHPRRNEIYRDVGTELHTPDDAEFVDILEEPLDDDCALLLCTDGLSDLLTREQMLRIEAENRGNPQGIVDALIAEANAAGGKDNITVVYVAANKE